MKIFSVFIFSAFTTISLAQLNNVNWQKTIGGTSLDMANIILQSDDNMGYYVISTSSSNIGFEKSENSYGGSDVWIVFVDNSGNVVWDKSYGGSQNETAKSALIFNSKLYVLSTSSSGQSGNKTAINHGLSDLWLLCLDFTGGIEWQESYGGGDVEGAISIIDNTNELIVIGNSFSQISGNKTENTYGESDYWILKVNSTTGVIIDQKAIGSTGFENCIDAVIDSTGNIYILGTSDTGISGLKTVFGHGDSDHWVVKVDPDFQLLNQACFGGSGSEFSFYGDIKIINNRIVISGTTNSSQSGSINEMTYGSNDAWAYVIDTNLVLEWSKLFGGNNADSGGKIVPFVNGSILFVFNSLSGISGNKTVANFGTQNDVWIVLTDIAGNIHSQTAIGGNATDFCEDAFLNNNNNVVITSTSNSGVSGMKDESLRGADDIWTLEINTSSLVNLPEISNNSALIIYPNPVNDVLNIEFTNIEHFKNANLMIYSFDGKVLLNERIHDIESQFNINSFASGSYVIKIFANEQMYQRILIRN